MGFEFTEVCLQVAGTQGVGKQGVLGNEGAGALDAAPDSRGGESLLALAQGVAQVGQQAVAAVVHDGLVELGVEQGVGPQVVGIQRGVLFLDGGVEDVGNVPALLGA